MATKATKWNNRRHQGNWLKKGIWNVIYYFGRIFSFGRWNPYRQPKYILRERKQSTEPSKEKFSIPSKLEKTATNLPPSLLERLPIEIATKVIAPNLTKKDLANVSQASKTTYKMFKEPLVNEAKLLYFVQEANYDKAEEMINVNPNLMFRYISYQKTDGTYEMISPLRFAFKVLDTYMWKMFYEKVKNDPKLLERFTQQAYAQTEHIDLELLHKAYESYRLEYDLWLAGQSADYIIDRAWLNIGKKQREIFTEARHLLKEFCRGRGEFWNPQSKFDVTVDPRLSDTDIQIYDIDTYRHYYNWGNQSVFPFALISGLGLQYSLLRGGLPCPVPSKTCPKDRPSARGRGNKDLATFHRFYEVRTHDLSNLLSQLKPLSGNMSNKPVI